jgi:hypothetical protein
MTQASGQDRRQNLVNLLVQISREQRASPAYYGNLRAAPGGLEFRRLVSSVGFPAGTSITYVTPASTNVQVGSEPRTGVTQIVFHPYGATFDVQRLTSSDGADRRFHETRTRLGSGVVPYTDDVRYVMPGYCLASSTAEDKDVEFVLDATTPRRAKSWHFYVNRAGDLIVNAAIDDVACVDGATDTTVNVAYESLVVVSREDHANNRVTAQTMVEAPLTLLQLRTLGVLTAKIETVFQQIVEEAGTGFTRIASEGFRNGNFTENLESGLPFDFTSSNYDAFFTFVDSLPDFDLSTDVFRPASSVEQIDRRELARTAISDTDTLGVRATILANYAAISGSSRAQDMQDRPRVSYFLRRSEAATQAANTTAQNATEVADADAGADDGGSDEAPVQQPNTDAFVYNFRTGQWGDRNPV